MRLSELAKPISENAAGTARRARLLSDERIGKEIVGFAP
jgi:hypothetical protein